MLTRRLEDCRGEIVPSENLGSAEMGEGDPQHEMMESDSLHSLYWPYYREN